MRAWIAVSCVLSLAGCAADDPPTCADANTLVQGELRVSCADRGELCQAGACVKPWLFEAPQWPTCAAEPHATPETLVQKAEYYDAIAGRLHVHPDLGVAHNVTLRAGADEKTATHADVERRRHGENDGLWSALYLASQAYRYAVTRSPEALAMIQKLMAAEETRMAITGVPGVFTREYVNPAIPGTACPTDLERYRVDLEKDDNRWVQIREDGCIWTVGRESGAWEKSSACGLGQFAGWCFLDNVSKDEYAGHMLALVLVMKLVDDVPTQAIVRRLLGNVARHLMANDLAFVDWDGRITEHGRLSPIALDDFPGFNAAMALAYVKAGADATGDAEIRAFYEDCLLQRKGPRSCAGIESPDSLLLSFEAPGANGMYRGEDGCGSNYNNIGMHMLSLLTLSWLHDDDLRLRNSVQNHLDVEAFRKDHPRAIQKIHNAAFDLVFAAHKKLGPGSDGHAVAAVEDAVCQLRQFRASQAEVSITLDARHQPYCKNRFDRDVSEHPRQTHERCAATFVWWGDPFSLDVCTADPLQVDQPSGYLLPYWMARYYGFIGAAQ